MKYYLLLLPLTVNVISAMSFIEKLDQECERARAINTQKRNHALEVAAQNWLVASHIPQADRDIIYDRYGKSVSIQKVPMGNQVVTAYFVSYTDVLQRNMRDFINCFNTEEGTKKLAVLSIRLMK